MRFVRKTITIDDDLAALLCARAQATSRTFRDTVDQVLRDGLLQTGAADDYVPPVHDLGIRPGADLTKALQFVGQMEDEENVRRMGISS